MISGNGTRAKLADFGLATFDKYTDEFGIGSERYMAPECLDFEEMKSDSGFSDSIDCYCAPAVDIWALGVLLFNMIFGRNPWHVASLTDNIFGAYMGSDPLVLKRSMNLTTKFDDFLRRKVFNLDPDERCSVRELNSFVQSQEKFVDMEELLSHKIECIDDGDTIQLFHQLEPVINTSEESLRDSQGSRYSIVKLRGSSPEPISSVSINHIGSVDIEKLTFSFARLDNPYVETRESRILLAKKLGLGPAVDNSERTLSNSNRFSSLHLRG